MTVLVWDQMDERRYETGIERGVLYPADGSIGVVWNGLVSVEETKARESKVYYHEGFKVFERLIAPAYSAKISAFTYPDVLDELAGNLILAGGVSLHDQRESSFHLSYRTRIGSALEGIEYGYKLHLVYNLIANPDDVSLESISNETNPVTFGWTVSGTQLAWRRRPVNHISIDSRNVDPTWLAGIEDQLYGTAGTDPTIPDLTTLLDSF